MVHRWIIKGKLAAVSAVAIATGEPETEKTSPKGAKGYQPGKTGDGDRADILAIDLDYEQRPYLPGSSLKGVLRAWLAQRFSDAEGDVIEELFGGLPSNRQAKTARGELIKTPLGGRIEVCDAFLANEVDLQCPWVGQTRIDRDTGAAEPGMLRHQRVVEAGATFVVEITCDNAAPEQIALILAALSAFNEFDGPRLGGDTGQGMGRMEWVQPAASISVIDAAAIITWLKGGAETSWQAIAPSQSASELIERAEAARADLKAAEPPEIRLELEIAFLAPFLTADPSRYAGKGHPDIVPRLRVWTIGHKEGDNDGDEEGGKEREECAIDPCPILPGASVKGVLRARAERIARTIGGRAEDAVKRIFGSTEQAGRLSVSDFVPAEGAAPETEVQEFVAVDRFTGGAAEAKKFQARPVLGSAAGDTCFQGELRLSLGHSPNHEKATGKRVGREDRVEKQDLEKASAIEATELGFLGLLALLGRDLLEGDLTFGSGAAKGFGTCRVRVIKARASGGAQARLAELLGRQPEQFGEDLLTKGTETWREWLAPAVEALCSPRVETAEAGDEH